ncbi:MAG: ABC transporter ATP-binding protein [Pseudomonadales bacterium]|nr:ABC transporter ATP-binding protein [Pseudomonadales bacterium]MCP5185695.1 ABC transporter ATP-binding protein [Pseudomonadales bacterium]
MQSTRCDLSHTASDPGSGERTLARVAFFLVRILGPDRRFYTVAVVYGIAISLLSLATPISVQMLVNTVAYTGMLTPLVVLSLALFFLLLAAGLVNALRIHLMDLFARRFYARLVSEVALRAIYAVNPFFADSGKGALFNRYFDIVVVLKSMPNLLVGGFTIVLQALVGFLLVSLYHPLFLLFNLVVILAVWLAWIFWGRRAIVSAVELSHRKHATAGWLEGLGASNGFFKSERHIDDALERTELLTASYIEQQKRHFRHHFAQTLWFAVVYAAASALLLGLGGWLVTQGELTLGQLVAAELVLSVVYYGISQLGVYLTYFYDLCAAIDELALFYDIEQEAFVEDPQLPLAVGGLTFMQASGRTRGVETLLDFHLPDGARVLAHSQGHAAQRIFTNFLKGHEHPIGGDVTLGQVDLRAIPAHTLRQQIIVLDRPNAIEMTIREYLRLSEADGDAGGMLEAIRCVGLREVIADLDNGLDTPIESTGWPLSITESMQLKLAAALIARPRVLVLGELYDVLPAHVLKLAFDRFAEVSGGQGILVYFSNRDIDLGFDHWLLLRPGAVERLPGQAAFRTMLTQGAVSAGAGGVA